MLRKNIASNKYLRKILFPLLRYLDIKLFILHPITKRIFFLKLWSHKGYWFYGSKREYKELSLIKKIISKGENILEAGAHIGFLTQVFEEIVTDKGEIIAVEPSLKNSILLKKNTKNKTKIVSAALSDFQGQGYLHLDNYGGFTNSLKKEFTNTKNIGLSSTQSEQILPISKTNVKIETIDSLCKKYSIQPNFIKIDVEGLELEVLKGAKKTLKNTNMVMIEINSHHEKIFNIMKVNKFYPINLNKKKISWDEIIGENKNYFFKKENLKD